MSSTCSWTSSLLWAEPWGPEDCSSGPRLCLKRCRNWKRLRAGMQSCSTLCQVAVCPECRWGYSDTWRGDRGDPHFYIVIRFIYPTIMTSPLHGICSLLYLIRITSVTHSKHTGGYRWVSPNRQHLPPCYTRQGSLPLSLTSPPPTSFPLLLLLRPSTTSDVP